MKSMKSVVLVLLVTLLCALPMFAQNSGSIQGTVVDPQGAVVAGATVQAIDAAKGIVVREATTGAEGNFVLQPLQPGTYNVKIANKGMKDLLRNGLVLDSRQVLGLGELKMAIGNVGESLTVEAVQPLVETATADHSNVISNQQITEISMNGRDFQSLVRTLPGIVSNDKSDFRVAFNNTDAFHVNGMRGSANNMFLDGAVNTDVGANDGQFTQLSMDAVGEFKIQASNFAAEYGRNPGVLMAVNTKSGGEKYHGTLYEFNRQDGFDANWLGNKINQTTGAALTNPNEPSKLRFHQFGGNIGGPVPLPGLKKKLFFFFNYEGTRSMNPDGGKGTSYQMADPAWLNGDFRSAYQFEEDGVTPKMMTTAPQFQAGQIFLPGSIQYTNGQITGGVPIPGNRITPEFIASLAGTQYANTLNWSAQRPALLNVLQPLYLPGFYTSDTPGQVTVPYQETYRFRKNQLVTRIDYNINAKTNFFFRWVNDSQKEGWDKYPIWSGGLPILPQFRQKPGSSWSWNLVNVISPTVTNEFIFSYNHLTQLVDTSASKAQYDKTALGFTNAEIFPQANTKNLLPQFNAGNNMQNSPFPPNWGSEGRQFTFTDNVTKIAGTHTLKFGAFYNFNRNGQAPWWVESPNFDFTSGHDGNFAKDTNNGTLNMLLGNYWSVSQSNGFFWGKFLFSQFELFAQDSWKVNRKLTLDYGLRWAYMGPTYTVKPFLENYFDPTKYDPAQRVSIYTGPNVYSNGQPVALNGSFCNATMVAAGRCPGVTNFGNPYNGMIQEGTPGYPLGFVKHRWNNFMPRFGFAYDPTGSGKTAIRGGVGVFFERVRQNVNSFDGLGNVPLMQTPNYYNGNIDSFTAGSAPISLPGTVRTMDREGNIPTIYSWSIGVQRELPWALALDVAYVGNQVRHLQYIADINQLPVGTTTSQTLKCGESSLVNCDWKARVPYVGYNNIAQTFYGANSSYNALQASLKRRFAKKLMIAANYTYSKNRTLSDRDDNFTSIRDTYHPEIDYGPSEWDRPHVFTANYIYTFPDFKGRGAAQRYLLGGWEVTGVITAASGTPFSAFCGGDGGKGPNSMGASYCDLVSGEPIYQKGGVGWLNPAAFAQPMPGTLGNTTRNQFRGPSYWNKNFSIFKNLQFTESMRMQLRLEMFNVFNHHSFGASQQGGNANNLANGGVNNVFTTPGPGQAATGGGLLHFGSERDPRMIQLGAKFYF